MKYATGEAGKQVLLKGGTVVGTAVGKSEPLAIPREHEPARAERSGAGDLAPFGSTARDEAGPGSEIDTLMSLPG